MKKAKKELRKSNRLKRLEGKLSVTQKSKEYLERELSTIKGKEEKLKDKIRKEKQAISLIDRAKKLRLQKRK